MFCNRRLINDIDGPSPPGLKRAEPKGEGGVASLAETLQRFEQCFGPDRVWRELWPVQGVARSEAPVGETRSLFFFP